MPLSKISVLDRLQGVTNDLANTFGDGSLVQLPGRGNSAVFKWKMKHWQCFVKIYPEETNWPRRRHEQRFSQYLAEIGLECHPAILHSNRNLNYTAFEFIIGKKPDPNVIGVKKQFLAFLSHLTDAKNVRVELNEAKEAFSSLRELVAQISTRRRFLGQIEDPSLKGFLEEKFDPAFLHYTSKNDLDAELPDSRFPSPSDIGLHNCLLNEDGQLIFFDFEYAGICSLYKLIGDVYWHPGFGFSNKVRREIVGKITRENMRSTTIQTAVELMGIKWALLLLNEFNPTVTLKRSNAKNTHILEDIKSVQLKKAEFTLAQLSKF